MQAFGSIFLRLFRLPQIRKIGNLTSMRLRRCQRSKQTNMGKDVRAKKRPRLSRLGDKTKLNFPTLSPSLIVSSRVRKLLRLLRLQV